MFRTGEERTPADASTVAGIAALAAVLVGLQLGALALLVGRPLEEALVATREPPPSMILVRVPEYVEELEVIGPPRWERDLLRLQAGRRAQPTWLADHAGAPAPLGCPASSR